MQLSSNVMWQFEPMKSPALQVDNRDGRRKHTSPRRINAPHFGFAEMENCFAEAVLAMKRSSVGEGGEEVLRTFHWREDI